jgi:hypothetical protein
MPATKRKPATAPDQAALPGLLISAGAGQARPLHGASCVLLLPGWGQGNNADDFVTYDGSGHPRSSTRCSRAGGVPGAARPERAKT